MIQSEAQLHAVYGRELAEAFIDNHRARVYYRPPVHRRDLAEQISKIVGQKTAKQTSFSYADGLSAQTAGGADPIDCGDHAVSRSAQSQGHDAGSVVSHQACPRAPPGACTAAAGR